MSAVRTVLVLCLASLCACEGSPGEARVKVYDPASAEPRWQQTVSAQGFDVEKEAPDGVLRVATSDYCWDSNFVIDFDRETGARLDQQRRGASAGTADPLGALDPPTACASGFVTQRSTLTNGERVDICAYTVDDELAVSNVADRRERFRLRPGGYRPLLVAGDQLLLSSAEPDRLETYSLLSGELLWSWTAPEPYIYVAGADTERVYLLAETSHESYAFALADGTAVWQKNLACDSLSLAGDVLVCHQRLRASSCDHD
ncbi:MAG: hypothetical protein RL033_6538 [Pseudomonadota bacterium]|jgi:hypothetical protein